MHDDDDQPSTPPDPPTAPAPPTVHDVWNHDPRRGAKDLSALDNDYDRVFGEPGGHTFLQIGEPGAAPLTREQTTALLASGLPDNPLALWQIIDTAMTTLAALPLAAETVPTIARAVEVSERVRRRLDGLAANLYLEASDRTVYREAGYLTMHTYLASGHRLGPHEAKRRRRLAAQLTSHTAISGEKLEPTMPRTADGIRAGDVSAAHALVIADVLNQLPDATSPDVKTRVEADLAEHARVLTPVELGKAGARLIALIDPDGAYTEPEDRQRRRGLDLFPQDTALMSRIRGTLTPRLRAKLDVILDAWAAPGMNNPDDPDSPTGPADHPELNRKQWQQARGRDTRSSAQRHHDALEAMCDWILGHKALGRPTRIPTEIVISITDADLARHAGVAIAATGTLIPVADLIELAAHATPYLAVFREHTCQPLYLGRAKKHRLASKGQRLMLFARDGGCTAPGCTAAFNRTQAHHSPDWQHGGRTNIDELGATCEGHNLWVGPNPGQWETSILHSGPNAGRMIWRAIGDPGPWKLNPTHHPDLLSGLLAHAPPDDRSRFEKTLETRLGLTLLRPDPTTCPDCHTDTGTENRGAEEDADTTGTNTEPDTGRDTAA